MSSEVSFLSAVTVRHQLAEGLSQNNCSTLTAAGCRKWRAGLSRFKGVPLHAKAIRVLITPVTRVAQAYSSLSAAAPTCDTNTPP